jgi:hypothetical protein
MADFSVEVDPPTDKPIEEERVMIPKIMPRETVLVEKKSEENQPVAKEIQPVAKVNQPLVKESVAKENLPLAKVNRPMEKENQPVISRVETQPTQIADTIEINNPHAIFPHIEPYPETSPKQHHFRFKHQSERTRLIQTWSQKDITVEFNESGKNNVDVTLSQGDRTIGKIQFIHFDRRDRSIRSKHYVKLYLYQFEDRETMEQAKQIMRTFFEEISKHPVHRTSIRKSSRKTRKVHRKKSKTRKHTK